VLFADQENVVVPNDQRPTWRGDDRWLELVARSEHQVSEEDLIRWRSEIAKPTIDLGD